MKQLAYFYIVQEDELGWGDTKYDDQQYDLLKNASVKKR